MGPAGLFDWLASGAARAFSLVSWGKKSEAPAIPPALVIDALERASKGEVGFETIQKLCLRAKDTHSATQEKLHIIDVLTEQIRSRILSHEDKMEIRDSLQQIAAELVTNAITDPAICKNYDLRFAVAKSLAGIDDRSISKNIKSFSLTEDDRFTIAKLCAQKSAHNMTQAIQDFGLSDPQKRIEVAKLCGNQSAYFTASNIKNFAIDDQSALIEIATVCAENKGGSMAQFFKNFGIEDQTERIKIAKLYAQQNGGETAQYIKDFKIKDPIALIAIAKLCAQQNGGATARYIKNFELQDEELRIAIAEICAQSEQGGTAEHIKEFDILDPVALKKIAILCTKHDPYGTPEHIKNFKIPDQASRIELAKLGAQIDGFLAKYIKNYEITDPAIRLEIAILSAKTSGQHTAKYITEFDIEDLKALKELAFSIAEQDGGAAVNIKAFKITDQNELITLAKMCAKKNAHRTAQHIQDFDITDQNVRFELAKECAKLNGNAIATHISNFGIQDPEELYEIAILAARQGFAAERIKNFGITDPDRLYTLALLSVQSSWFHTVDHLDNFGITDQNKLRELLATALVSMRVQPVPESISNPPLYILKHMPQELEDPKKWALFNFIKMLSDISDNEIKKNFRELFNGRYENELADIMKSENPKNALIQFVGTYAYLNQVCKASDGWFKENGPLRMLINMEREGLSNKVAEAIFRLATKGNAAPEVKEYNHKSSWKTLAGLVYKDLEQQQVDPKILEQIQQAVEKNKSFEVYTYHDPLMEMLLTVSEWEGSSKDKTAILAKLLPTPSLVDIQAITSMFLFQEPLKLLGDKTLQKALEELLIEKLSLHDIEQFTEKYAKTFNKSRFPAAVPIYAAKLSSLYEPAQAMQALKTFITQVLNGTFSTDRYKTENCPHLQRISEKHADVVAKWQQSRSLKLGEQGQMQESQRDWLSRAIFTENLLPLLNTFDPNYVKRYLEGDAGAKAKLDDSLRKPENRVKQGVFSPLRFQRTLIEVAESDGKRTNEIIAIFERLVKSVENQNQPAFLQALKTQIETLKKRPAGDELMVFDSDDPMDLLLCGYEVYGSCQSINGDPEKNMGLLGYMLNGWNRVLKVSTGKDDAMVARCKFQLLWDGEQPVLFLERFYSKGPLKPEHKAAIDALAKKKAAELGIPLLCHSAEGKPYGKQLFALGGPAPYEYTDAGGGTTVRKKGEYSIKDVCYLS